jgi:hypothetical protein
MKSRTEVFAKEAESLAKRRETLAMELLAILEDKNQSDRERFQAAHALGQLQYLPALPKIAQHITLLDSNASSSPVVPGLNATIEQQYPCIEVLASFGSFAVPTLVQEFLQRAGDQKTQYLLMCCIRRGDMLKAAKQYLLSIPRADLHQQQRIDLAKMLLFLEER